MCLNEYFSGGVPENRKYPFNFKIHSLYRIKILNILLELDFCQNINYIHFWNIIKNFQFFYENNNIYTQRFIFRLIKTMSLIKISEHINNIYTTVHD